jgi:hypothetical protein
MNALPLDSISGVLKRSVSSTSSSVPHWPLVLVRLKLGSNYLKVFPGCHQRWCCEKDHTSTAIPLESYYWSIRKMMILATATRIFRMANERFHYKTSIRAIQSRIHMHFSDDWFSFQRENHFLVARLFQNSKPGRFHFYFVWFRFFLSLFLGRPRPRPFVALNKDDKAEDSDLDFMLTKKPKR